MNGAFVVFEGIDGAGKTTICNNVAGVLLSEGVDTIVTYEPTNGIIGELIRSEFTNSISQRTQALLFCADRTDHTEDIKRWISEGKVVLCDRYFASTLAYQSCGMYKDSIDKDWLIRINDIFIGIPNLSILLDINPSQSIKRIHSRNGTMSKFEDPVFLECVRNNYLQIAEDYNFRIVDASKDKNQVLSKVINIINEVI